MDEIEHLPLHQWLCACRQLMLFEPAVGASAYEDESDAPAERYQLGWNRVLRRETAFEREIYVYITPGGGCTTPVPPPDVDIASLPTVEVEFAPPRESRLWRRTLQLADDVAALDLPHWSPSRVERTMESIAEAVERDPGTHDAEGMRQSARRCLAQLVQARNGSLSGATLIDDFLQPARDVVRAFASFEITGSIAREVLALVLQVQCNLPILGPPQMTSPTARGAAFKHLVNKSDQMMMRRAQTRVTPYFELTYLAGLLAATAVTLAVHSRELSPGYHGQGQLENQAKYIEELGAYGVWPAFALPAAYSPLETLQAIASRAALIGKPAREIAGKYALHPALKASLSEFGPTLDERTALAAYQRRAADFEHLDGLAWMDEDAGLVAVENAEEMAAQLSAIAGLG